MSIKLSFFSIYFVFGESSMCKIGILFSWISGDDPPFPTTSVNWKARIEYLLLMLFDFLKRRFYLIFAGTTYNTLWEIGKYQFPQVVPG